MKVERCYQSADGALASPAAAHGWLRGCWLTAWSPAASAGNLNGRRVLCERTSENGSKPSESCWPCPGAPAPLCAGERRVTLGCRPGSACARGDDAGANWEPARSSHYFASIIQKEKRFLCFSGTVFKDFFFHVLFS